MTTLGVPQCVPVFTRDQRRHTESLPKYLVVPGCLADCVEQDNMRLKIIDLGEGSLLWSQLHRWTLSSSSFLQYRSSSRPPYPFASSGTRGPLQSSFAARGH